MRSGIALHAVSLLCSSTLLLACSAAPWRQDVALSATAGGTADDSYLRGRTLYLARHYGDAIAAYEAALSLDAGHVKARNGLAIAYAEQRDFGRAIAIWQDLTRDTTMASGPASAFLFANLGYAHLLGGDAEAARIALEKACLLDPLSQHAWQYLGEALLQLGQEERGQQMLRQAEALRDHDLRADYATVHGDARVPAIEQAVDTSRQPDDGEWAVVDVIRGEDGILELRRTPAKTRAPNAPAAGMNAGAVTGIDSAAGVVRLEISNGAGRQGLARLVSHGLRDPALKVIRLTNEKNFNVRATRIEYQGAFRTAAQRLARHMGSGEPVEVGFDGPADVRLVLGRDVARANRNGAP